MPDTDEKIRTRAYSLWVEEGFPEGRELDHWLQAKRELDREALLDDLTSEVQPGGSGSDQEAPEAAPKPTTLRMRPQSAT